MNLSITYAGDPDYALQEIRKVHRYGLPEEDITLALVPGTANGRVEYLISSHQSGHPHFRKVWEGRVSGPLNQAFIGNLSAYRLFEEVPYRHDPGQIDEEFRGESTLSSKWLNLAHQNGVRFAPGVGGVPAYMIGSPRGYCYANWSFSNAWNTITIPENPVQNAMRLAREAAGDGAYKLSFRGAHARGVSVAGCYLEQAKSGWLYIPLQEPEVELLAGVDMATWAAEMDRRAMDAGGIEVSNS